MYPRGRRVGLASLPKTENPFTVDGAVSRSATGHFLCSFLKNIRASLVISPMLP